MINEIMEFKKKLKQTSIRDISGATNFGTLQLKMALTPRISEEAPFIAL